MPSSILARRGVHVEPDGSIVLDRSHIAPAQAVRPESGRADHIRYPVANRSLTAAFENPARIAAYSAFGVGPILEPDAWRTSLTVDGRPLVGYPPLTRVRGRLMMEAWQEPAWQLTVSSFCEGENNVVYQVYTLTSRDGQAHTLETVVRAGLLAGEDQTSYALHFDERSGAIVAGLGETVLHGEPKLTLPARAALIGADRSPVEWGVSDRWAYLTYRLETPQGGEQALGLVVTGGWGRSEHEVLFQEATTGWRQALQAAQNQGDWLATRLEVADPELHALYTGGLSCALAAYHEDEAHPPTMGPAFHGLTAAAAGEGSAVTRPGDAYWCAQALLPFRPEWVREEILTLARAVDEEGRVPLAVPAWPGIEPAEWERDACDAPSYFALLVHDYLCWTDDCPLLDVQVGDTSIWEKVQACVNSLRRRDSNHDMLFEKGREQPDWAADVLRDDWVTYDLALHYQALKATSEIALLRGDEETARDLADWAQGAQRAINQRLWDEGKGYYVDYIRSYQGFVERHAAIDTVVTTLYGLASENQSHRHLDYLARMLETRHNEEQYYGDWGLMSCFPFYRERDDLTGRSRWAYSYHNGAAWPGWSGVYALAALLHRRDSWRYALERWWTYGLAQYWFAPVQWYAPPYDAPGLRQSDALFAWSAMPAAAMVLGGFGVWPNLAGAVVLRVPPWGDSRLNGVRLRGETYDIEARADRITVYQRGEPIASDRHGLRVHLGRAPVATVVR